MHSDPIKRKIYTERIKRRELNVMAELSVTSASVQQDICLVLKEEYEDCPVLSAFMGINWRIQLEEITKRSAYIYS